MGSGAAITRLAWKGAQVAAKEAKEQEAARKKRAAAEAAKAKAKGGTPGKPTIKPLKSTAKPGGFGTIKKPGKGGFGTIKKPKPRTAVAGPPKLKKPMPSAASRAASTRTARVAAARAAAARRAASSGRAVGRARKAASTAKSTYDYAKSARSDAASTQQPRIPLPSPGPSVRRTISTRKRRPVARRRGSPRI
jgi:Sec-independent protein translocase protein TatA